MKTNFLLGLLVLLCCGLFSFMPDGEDEKKIDRNKYQTYLGCSKDGRGYISQEKFVALVDYPLCAWDSSGNRYKVKSFEVSYAETGLYQDEEGLPIRVTDYSQGVFKSGSFNDIWKGIFRKRAYKGDTIRIENVIVYGKKDLPAYAQNIMLVIR